jgi:hypothetical protein
VAEAFQFKAGSKTIHISTTEQRLSGQAGQAALWAFLHRVKLRSVLAAALPHRPTSPNALPPVEQALGFIAGLVAGARKLTQVAWLRGDPVLPELLQIGRVSSQSSLSRFFGVFQSGAANLACFERLWRWSLARLPVAHARLYAGFRYHGSGPRDGRQEGVRIGHTRLGLKPCLQPMLAVLAEVKLCAQFWLRPGHAHCSNNLLEFTRALLRQLPAQVRVRLIRADSGFFYDPWLELLEARRLRYIVVADLSVRIKSLLRKTTVWHPTKVAGMEVAEVCYESKSASRPRRLILLRRSVAAESRGGGKLLLEVPGYKFQALVTNLPPSVSPLQVWFEYNGRAGIENVIKELRHGFALPDLCCQKFFATEAALSLAVFTYNLTVLFARHLGWLEKVTIETLRHRLFRRAGILSWSQGRTTLRLGIPPAHRAWWAQLWHKLSSPFPNCDAVAQSP